MIEVIAIFALFATVFPIGKFAFLYSQPIFLTSIRMVCAGSILYFYSCFFGAKQPKSDASFYLYLILLTIFNIYLTNVCEFWGLQYLSIAKTSFIYNLSPFISALLCYVLYGERMTVRKWLGLLIGFLGFVPILLQSSQAEDLIGGIGFLSWPELSLLTAATSTVIGWIVMQKMAKEGFSVVYVNGISMFFGGIVALITSYFVEVWDPYPYTELKPFLWYMIVLMCISNIFAYNIYGQLLKRYSATFLTFAGFTCPLWAALYGWLFLGEAIYGTFIASFLAVFIGLYLFYSEDVRLGYIQRP